MTAWIAPTSRSDGFVVTAAVWNQDIVTNATEAFPDGAEAFATSSWTPTVKFGATAATVASETHVMRIGRLVVATFAIRLTNLNGGSGTLSITRPYAGLVHNTTTFPQYYGTPVGRCFIVDASTANMYDCACTANLTNGSDFVLRTTAVPIATPSNTSPFTVAVGAASTGDEYHGMLWYEAAS